MNSKKHIVNVNDPLHPRNEKWLKYGDAGNPPIKDGLQKSIIESLASVRDQSGVYQHVKGGFTNLLKYKLLILGYSMGYCGYANLRKSRKENTTPDNKAATNSTIKVYEQKIADYVNTVRLKFKFNKHEFCSTEWLYDIHWYRDVPNTHYMPENLYMAGEIELWNKRAVKKGHIEHSNLEYTEARYDFQKLLSTNAELRVMICRVRDEKFLSHSKYGLGPYFVDAIHAYTQLEPGSKFLLACYIKRELYYHIIYKRQKTSP